jgi:hypothetical protein
VELRALFRWQRQLSAEIKLIALPSLLTQWLLVLNPGGVLGLILTAASWICQNLDSAMSSGTHRPPPTVLLKQDEYEPFGEKACLEKLHKVGRTTDSIRKTAAWVFHHRNHLAQFVKIWIAEFRRGMFFLLPSFVSRLLD